MKHPNEKALYIIRKSPHDDGQVVLHVTDTFKEGYVCFYDTNRGHMIKGIITFQEDKTFTIRDKHNEEWIFEIVTIDMYKENIYRYVFEGKSILETCHTTEELWEYFRKLFPI